MGIARVEINSIDYYDDQLPIFLFVDSKN